MLTIHKLRIKIIFAVLLLNCSMYLQTAAMAANQAVIYVKQGDKWTDNERNSFYSQDQGSQIMPLKWFQALKQANGQLFLADGLKRYGYLPNPASPTPGLPVGFTVNDQHVGMTCSACHVREIKVDNDFYRIDGGPAIVDFQTFALDLDNAVKSVLDDSGQFADFAKSVLSPNAPADKVAALRKDVAVWYLPYHTIMDLGPPKDKPWGPVRMDAVGMIFNRLTGLDIGASADHIIAKNIQTADAPVRYPFIWNAPIQDKTQWPGFADNGNDLLGLARNLGEVIGVFAHFHPQKDDFRVLGVDYFNVNSANFQGLKLQENHVKKIGPPQWPWLQGAYAIDQKLAAQGENIFNSTSKTEAGGCVGCHGIRDGAMRSEHKTWATPLCDVKTDNRQFNLLKWTVDTGVLAGAQVPFLDTPLLAKNEPAINVLGLAVTGSILQHDTSIVVDLENAAKKEAAKFEALIGAEKTQKIQAKVAELRQMQGKLVTKDTAVLQGAFHKFSGDMRKPADNSPICKEDFKAAQPVQVFESRVLQGIWATAPYLHNGSIPTLSDLLKPVSERAATFKVGQAYDPTNVGLAKQQSQFDYTYRTTDCAIRDSGNSRCGHEFGAKLSADEKKALLEYLKKL
ncbi:MAG: di-heme-cytochrome C peroxidase [Methylomonas sp.]|jgi:cytochrome c peroxidase